MNTSAIFTPRAVLENIFNGQVRVRIQDPSAAEIRQQLLNLPDESFPEPIPWAIAVRRSQTISW